MRYEKFINELKNIPTIKEKQDALDAINLLSKILFEEIISISVFFYWVNILCYKYVFTNNYIKKGLNKSVNLLNPIKK